MKKSVIALLVLTIALFATAAVMITKTLIQYRQDDFDEEKRETYREQISEIAESNKKGDNVPVYEENSLFFDTNALYTLGRDSGLMADADINITHTADIMQAYPTNSIRERTDGSVYFVYDSDTHFRLFLLFGKENDLMTPVGYPVVVGRVHSSEDFSRLNRGDSIDEVEEIDDVVQLYKKQYIEVWNLNSTRVKFQIEHGYPPTTIHYLNDGILKIQYSMNDHGQLVIYDMEYHEDYKLVDQVGRTIDYKVMDIDLPA